jgi:putative methyltransferase
LFSVILAELRLPRYARVNLLKTTLDDAISTFADEGWQWVGELSVSDFQGQVNALGEDQFGRDALLSDLLIFPPGTELHEHPLTLSGKVVLQDRVSYSSIF